MVKVLVFLLQHPFKEIERRVIGRFQMRVSPSAKDQVHFLGAPVPGPHMQALDADLTVLPLDTLRQAPLSGIDERPMPRASAAQLRLLLAEEEIAGYESDT